MHDGFYLRLGAGPGMAFGSAKLGDVSADAKGVAIGTEIAFGTTVASGLVVGGGAYPMIVPSPTYTLAGKSSDVGAHHVGALGPFVDWYPDPAKGLHAQLALLLSATQIDGKNGSESGSGVGFGAMTGGGYEFWIGDQWSIGPIARLTYYRVEVKGSDSGVKTSLSLFAPMVLLGVTYH